MACSASREAPSRSHNALFRAFHRTVDRWRRWRTEREIEAMPYEIRKDIGWPVGADSGC
jgi:hypothetical protein